MANLPDPFISRLVGTLIDMAKEEVDLVLGVPGEIQKLQRTLRKIQRVLRDAEQRRIEDSTINDWLKELKDVMYDADDILDECRIAAGQWTPRESFSKASTVCCRFPGFPCVRQVKFTHAIGIKIKDLNLKLEDISAQRSNLDLKASSKPRVVFRVTRKTSPVMESDIVGVGIDEDAMSLVELLTKDKPSGNVPVLAIVGIGGVGKTTLAQKVFHDDKIKVSFGKMMWVCVSQEFTETHLLTEIISSAGGRHDGEQSRAQLEPMVEDLLRGENFLLVLDDVWNAQVWEDLLRNPLRGGAVGSRVLVTTRDEGIAKSMKSFHIHIMKLLPPEDCWSLLCKKVARDEDEKRDVQGLKDIGMKIVEKCDGLPLAIKTIGGVLCKRGLSRRAWDEVLRSAAWSQTGLPEGVRAALYLSYEDLPHHLKQCFLYCALFREDHVFWESQLVRFWIAEGFVQAEGDLTLEAIGEEYFEELCRRSLLQVNDGDRYKMHDLLRSLGQFLTRYESLVVGDAQKGLPYNAASMKLRRLSIVVSETEEINHIINLTNRQESVRTLLLGGGGGGRIRANEKNLDDYFKNFLRLRVLDLSWTEIQMIPHYVGNLVHLRYLDLTFSHIKELPESIGNLTNLQFLLIWGCRHLQYLPKGVVKLRNLRSLCLDGDSVEGLPSGIGRLEHLNELDGFVVSNNSTNDHHHQCSLEEVSTLRNLRILWIHKLERAWIEAEPGRDIANVLKGNQSLEHLELNCSLREAQSGPMADYTEVEIERIEKVFDTTLHPPSSLQVLELSYFFGLRYPSWLTSNSISSLLPNLRRLDVYRCCERCPWFPPLGKLPNLETLTIDGASAVVSIGPEFFGCEAATGHYQAEKSKDRSSPVLFPRLRILQLSLMPNLEEWHWVAKVHGVAMPRLETLLLGDSPKLKSLPEGLSSQANCLATMTFENVSMLRSICSFPFVKELVIMGKSSLEIVSDLPALEVLRLPDCWQMRSLPKWLTGGLSRFTALQRLEMECGKQVVRRCLQNGEYWPLIRNVPVVSFRDGERNYIDYVKHSSTFRTNLNDDNEHEGIDADDDDN